MALSKSALKREQLPHQLAQVSALAVGALLVSAAAACHVSAKRPSVSGHRWRGLQTLPPALNIALRTLQIRLLR